MGKQDYIGYIIDKSQKDKNIFKQLKVTNQKKVWCGLITIYEVKVEADKINDVIKMLQENMVNHVGFFKQEFYFHFYSGDKLIVVYRNKIFYGSRDKATWVEAQDYGRHLGIAFKQLDFLTPEENSRRYFS